ncbi:MAG: hypothetical protein BWZ08_02540 [candidate division BRC1 bacterium ADurb.BinA292]|nr:MAG: hypothetical protein BWZ08_02540 [candidate division BRC1 bacterium ADurb.BinA292]
MQQPQRRLQRHHQHCLRRPPRFGPIAHRSRRRLAVQPVLHQLHIPVAVLIPRELVDGIDISVECVAFQRLIRPRDRLRQRPQKPVILPCQRRIPVQLREPLGRQVLGVHQHEARGVPQLVAEIPHRFEPLLAQADVPALRRIGGQRQPDRIGADLLDHLQRVDRRPARLAHLLAVLVHHQRIDHHLPERHVAHELQAHHDHPRDPEEDDLVRRHQVVRRIVARQVLRPLGPAQRRKRPQRRAEPRVQHIGILRHLLRIAPRAARRRPLDLAPDVLARAAVENRNPMPPPELAADAPVAHVFHPVVVDVRVMLRHEPHPPRAHRLHRRLAQRPHPHEPLLAQVGLHHAARPIVVSDRVNMILNLDQQTLRLQVRHDPLARLRHRQPGIGPGVGVERPVGIQNVDEFQIVPPAHLVVVRIVRRRHLDRPRPEFPLHQRIGDDRDRPPHQRQRHLLADHPAVALVLGMHRHRRVAEHRLGPRRRHLDRPRTVGQRITDMPQVAPHFLVHHLVVRQRRLQRRRPVDQVVAAIDQSLFVQLLEHRQHRARQPLVHRKPRPRPVARAAQPTQLVDDPRAVLLLPRPDPFQKRLASQVAPVFLFLVPQPALHHVLRRDAGVIRPRHPQRVAPLHSPPARQDVLQRVVQCVADVQKARYVGRWDDDRVRLGGRLGPRFIQPPFVPPIKDRRLDRMRIIPAGEFLLGRGRHARAVPGWG